MHVTPVPLEVPASCPTCGRVGTVKLEQTIKGQNVELRWCCQACDARWPVAPRTVPP